MFEPHWWGDKITFTVLAAEIKLILTSEIKQSINHTLNQFNDELFHRMRDSIQMELGNILFKPTVEESHRGKPSRQT